MAKMEGYGRLRWREMAGKNGERRVAKMERVGRLRWGEMSG